MTVKCLLHNHKDLSLDSQYSWKAGCDALWASAWNLSAGEEEDWRILLARALLASYSCQISEL